MKWCQTGAITMLLVVGCTRAPFIADGTYYGYESMDNLSPDQPEAHWYHENVLTVRGQTIRIEKYPRWLVDDNVRFSASDGGFYTFEGSMEAVAGRTLVKLRLAKCDYCAIDVGDSLPSKRTREYVVTYERDGSFELDRVRYRREADSKLHGKPDV
jgi:hypothetical protein